MILFPFWNVAMYFYWFFGNDFSFMLLIHAYLYFEDIGDKMLIDTYLGYEIFFSLITCGNGAVNLKQPKSVAVL